MEKPYAQISGRACALRGSPRWEMESLAEQAGQETGVPHVWLMRPDADLAELWPSPPLPYQKD